MSKNNLHLSFKSYLTGFILSIGLTLAAYLLVVQDKFSNKVLIIWIIGLALVQFVVQAVFFLHLGRESKPRWNLQVFLFMILIVLIVVIGSLWIMSNLDYHHDHALPPDDIDRQIIEDEGIRR